MLCTGQNQSVYWGKLLKVFSDDVDDEANQVEIQFLKKVVNSSDNDSYKVGLAISRRQRNCRYV